MVWLCFAIAAVGAADASTELTTNRTTLVTFSESPLPDFVRFNNSRAGDVTEKGREISFAHVDWPNIFLRAPDGEWDWSDYDGVGFSLYNPSDTGITVAMRLDNDGADGMNFCNNLRSNLLPGQRREFTMLFNRPGDRPLWGMRGTPGPAQYGEGEPLDLTRITAVQLFLPMPDKAYALVVDEAYVFSLSEDAETGVPLPFVDRFGQYKHDEWPGKLASEDEFATRKVREQAAWEAAPELPGRDRFGGWADGPKRKATGWFRTEEIDGVWWLITPEGTLFFSLGITCVGTWERTFVDKREDWFAWLPAHDDPLFGGLYSEVSGAHSMAEPIGGAGKTFGFYSANLIRKYGEAWQDKWRASVYPRLRHWGFNTIANWSQEDVLKNSDIPFVVSTSLYNVRLIEGARGYWNKMMDVYDPSFEENVASATRYIAAQHADNPLCIGYFVDNELAWEGVVDGVLASSSDQPARQELYRFLRERYESLEALNAAWGIDVADWGDLDGDAATSATAQKDLSDYFYDFSLRYFTIIRDALREHAPNQLYLGCRFSTTPEEAVRACAEVADVVSANLYYDSVPPDKWTGDACLGAPIMIGEFHFGALDRGMFHNGLVAAKDQEDRAAKYKAYVRSVVDNPAFVGCHWFQYIDEPITGRWFDGENYNIGFLDVTDTPYPEMVEAARQVHEEVYVRRYGADE